MALPKDMSSAVVIPTLNDGTAQYSLRIDLDNVGYVFDFNFSPRENVWYLDILDDDRDPLLMGIKLIQNYYLCEYQKEFRRLFSGDLVILTGTKAKNPPGLKGLGVGSSWKMVYIPG